MTDKPSNYIANLGSHEQLNLYGFLHKSLFGDIKQKDKKTKTTVRTWGQTRPPYREFYTHTYYTPKPKFDFTCTIKNPKAFCREVNKRIAVLYLQRYIELEWYKLSYMNPEQAKVQTTYPNHLFNDLIIITELDEE